MKGAINLLVGIILGVIPGWVLGFLRLPFIEQKYSFWIGFIFCLALVLFIISFLFVWNKNAFLVKLISKNTTFPNSKNYFWTYSTVWIVVSLFIFVGGSISSILIDKQNKLFRMQTQIQNKNIDELSELVESLRKSDQILLMGNVLDNIENEINYNPRGELSDAIIARVAALSFSLKPYRYLKGDSLSPKLLSPERGQLLLALSLMNIDSISFAKIKQVASFDGADLRQANLKKADLSGINLKGADLQDADMQGSDLSKAEIIKGNLWGSILNNGNLNKINLQNADLRWAELNGVMLKSASLDGADLTDAKLRKSDVTNTSFQWANLNGVMLNEANMSGVDLLGANLSHANLNQANLMGARLKNANLTEANLTEVDLTNVAVEKGWLEKLNDWNLIGSEEIQENYKVVEDTSGRFENDIFFLKKVK